MTPGCAICSVTVTICPLRNGEETLGQETGTLVDRYRVASTGATDYTGVRKLPRHSLREPTRNVFFSTAKWEMRPPHGRSTAQTQ